MNYSLRIAFLFLFFVLVHNIGIIGAQLILNYIMLEDFLLKGRCHLHSTKRFLVKEDSMFHYEEQSANLMEGAQILSLNAIFFILDGFCQVSYDQYKDHVFKSGEMFFIPRGAVVSNMITMNVKWIYFTFDTLANPFMKRSFEKFNSLKDHICFNFTALEMKLPMVRFLTLLIHYITKDAEGYQLNEMKQEELFYIFDRFYNRAEFILFFYPIIGENFDFRNFVLKNYRPNIRVRELAELHKVSENVFMRKFKREFGVSASKWIIRKTCQRIILKASQPNVIALDLMKVAGINDATQLNQFCRKHFGQTPKKLIVRCQRNELIKIL